jgi:hypothetical protein
MKKYFVFLIILGSFLISGCTHTATSSPDDTTPKSEISNSQSDDIIQNEDQPPRQYTFSATKDGQTAFDLLDSQTEIEADDYGDAGMFVTSINGLAGDSDHYWAFYVNGEYGQTGASQTELELGDTIDFIYEEVSDDAL